MNKRQFDNEKITALYCRLSQDDGREGESNSIVNQRTLLNEYARKNYFKNLRFFVDDGYSGTNFDRPAFKELEALVESGEVGTVIVKDMSRLGRNYLQVGIYTDIVFPDNDVRFIAINDNVDSSVQTEFDMTPIRNFCNELYAKDTAKKIKTSFKIKSESGKHLSVIPPFGYVKDEIDKNKWVIDEAAASIVRYVFKLCVSGYGPTQIAIRLKNERVSKPTAYWAMKAGKPLPDNPYRWTHNTIAAMLEMQDYTGCTVNNKTVKKTFRSKNRIDTQKESRLIFENTQPAIIDQETFDIVQEIRSHKHRITKSGRTTIFSGKVFCYDCKDRLYFNTTVKGEEHDFFSCSNYKYDTGTCTCHYIRHTVLKQVVLQHMKNVLSYIQEYEGVFVKDEVDKANVEHMEAVKKAKKDIGKLQTRSENLDLLFKRLYEDLVSGRISEQRFDILSADYENEQKQVKAEIEKMQALIEDDNQQQYDLQQFLKNVRKYTDPEELTAEMVNTLIDRIEVHAPDKSSGKRKQKIDIYYKAIGVFNVPDEDESLLRDENGNFQKKQTA